MYDALWLLLVVLTPLLIFLFIFRLIFTWFPRLNLNQFPYNLVAWPTEVVLRPTRKVVPLFGGVDMSPLIWVALVALLQELLVGQQGILTILKSRF
ncbi:YggT family protein [Candidatus Cyanaurora vandensis]|uniref:YggT family protein n=1 Tax=Candidatus Cyanaurora vandensis TaxID=2714958 RepID=UPI00257CF926|nr:YggT family protein [Candidatus Cyanaurora vandensis]